MPYRDRCERCQGVLLGTDEAYVCSYDCTFCARCSSGLSPSCPNCGGELVRRARRKSSERPSSTAPRAGSSGASAVSGSTWKVVPVGLQDLEEVALLFDQYRVFYRQPSDPGRAREFLRERLMRHESVIFAVRDAKRAVGFVQLYPLFSSISCSSIWVLNDLYVVPDHRQQGIASRLLEHAKSYARETGATSVLLDTATDNPAQHLYEAHGWKRDTEFLHYEWARDGSVPPSRD